MLNSDIVGSIEDLAQGISTCQIRCAGIACDAVGGRPPRGLLLEERGRSGRRRVVVVGLNPGRARASERALLRGQARPYPIWRQYWEEHHRDHHPYFTGVRALLDQAGESGPILWTDVAKCESATGAPAPPIETLSVCAQRYLQYELFLVPDWPLLALGRATYAALLFAFPARAILGVPHPSGAGPNFRRLFQGRLLKPQVLDTLQQAFATPAPSAQWVATA